MWKLKEDKSNPIITAKKHVTSSHRGEKAIQLPPKAVVYCIGIALDYLKNNYETKVIIKKLPKFIGDSECLMVQGHEDVCFVHGGYGAPAIADTVETLIALGVREIILVGMCGGFSENINVGDVIIPNKIWSEEGTTLHYYEKAGFINQAEDLVSKGVNYFSKHFNTYKFNTVTTDSVYRQTFYKEDCWRKLECAGVEMEASALLSVSRYYEIEANVILLVSDKHPMNEDEQSWDWGCVNFNEIKEKFIDCSIKYAIDNKH